VELDQIQVHDWDEEAEEEEAAEEEEELARVQQKIERLWQEQESIMRRQVVVQRIEARKQHISREWARLAELQYTVDILHQQEERQEAPLNHIHHHHRIIKSPTNHLHHPHHTTISSTNHHLRRKSAPQIPKAHWPNTYNSHHGPWIIEQSHHQSTMATPTLTNFSCVMKPQ
jgi:hypothetical protein